MKHGFPTDFKGIPEGRVVMGGYQVWPDRLSGWVSLTALFRTVCFKLQAHFLFPGGYIYSFIVIAEKGFLECDI